jgi:hypothetical protein
MTHWDAQRHDDPANCAQDPIDRAGRASIGRAQLGLAGPGMLATLRDAPIKEDSNGLVPCERSLEMLVEKLAIGRDDDELLDPLLLFVVPFRRRGACVTSVRATRRRGRLEKPRERDPRRASARGAPLEADFKALVAIETQEEISQRQMHIRHTRSIATDH